MARIMVIDDQASVRAVIRMLIEKEGHVVVEASNGRLGVEALTPAIDLVITDILMPEMDGLEVVRHVKRLNRHLPVLVITGGWGEGGPDLVSLAERYGADGALSKADIRSTLIATVSRLLAAAGSRPA